jgi:hypothetical protein
MDQYYQSPAGLFFFREGGGVARTGTGIRDPPTGGDIDKGMQKKGGESDWEVWNLVRLFLEGQNWFSSKEIWVRPISSSATSTSGQSGSCKER